MTSMGIWRKFDGSDSKKNKSDHHCWFSNVICSRCSHQSIKWQRCVVRVGDMLRSLVDGVSWPWLLLSLLHWTSPAEKELRRGMPLVIVLVTWTNLLLARFCYFCHFCTKEVRRRRLLVIIHKQLYCCLYFVLFWLINKCSCIGPKIDFCFGLSFCVLAPKDFLSRVAKPFI